MINKIVSKRLSCLKWISLVLGLWWKHTATNSFLLSSPDKQLFFLCVHQSGEIHSLLATIISIIIVMSYFYRLFIGCTFFRLTLMQNGCSWWGLSQGNRDSSTWTSFFHRQQQMRPSHASTSVRHSLLTSRFNFFQLWFQIQLIFTHFCCLDPKCRSIF